MREEEKTRSVPNGDFVRLEAAEADKLHCIIQSCLVGASFDGAQSLMYK